MPSRSILLTKYASSSDLPERKRQELGSAIHTVARALGQSPQSVPADRRLLASRLKEVAPAAISISRARWNNIRSLVRTTRALGRNRDDLLPDWAALSHKLESRSDRIALSGLLRFCSARGISPSAVTVETFDYHAHLEYPLLKTPHQTFAMTVKAWQRAQIAVTGWPQIGVVIPDRRRQCVFVWDRFPEALYQDCQAWCDRLAGVISSISPQIGRCRVHYGDRHNGIETDFI